MKFKTKKGYLRRKNLFEFLSPICEICFLCTEIAEIKTLIQYRLFVPHPNCIFNVNSEFVRHFKCTKKKKSSFNFSPRTVYSFFLLFMKLEFERCRYITFSKITGSFWRADKAVLTKKAYSM